MNRATVYLIAIDSLDFILLTLEMLEIKEWVTDQTTVVCFKSDRDFQLVYFPSNKNTLIIVRVHLTVHIQQVINRKGTYK